MPPFFIFLFLCCCCCFCLPWNRYAISLIVIIEKSFVDVEQKIRILVLVNSTTIIYIQKLLIQIKIYKSKAYINIGIFYLFVWNMLFCFAPKCSRLANIDTTTFSFKNISFSVQDNKLIYFILFANDIGQITITYLEPQEGMIS